MKDNSELPAYQEESDLTSLEKATKLLEVQLLDMPPDTKGIIFLKYGTPNYMVSGTVARKIMDKLKPIVEEKYPGVTVVMIPFYIETEMIDLSKFLNKET